MSGIMQRLRLVWRSRRVRILASAIIAGVVCGAIELGLPLEDVLIGVRNMTHTRPADGTVAVVSLDDKTLGELNASDASRADDALLIEKLMADGAKRVFFDRSYTYTKEPAEDAKLIAVLKRYPGRVYMGAMPAAEDGVDDPLSMLPAPEFRPYAGIVSLAANKHPADLSILIPYSVETTMGRKPSMASVIADMKDLPDGEFRPDYSIDYRTIPDYSYIDVIRDRLPPGFARGKDVVIAPAARVFHDLHHMPLGDFVSGAFFHVIAAQTLKEGPPIDLGWLPAMVLVVPLLISGMRRGRSIDRYRVTGLVAILIVTPLILDHYLIEVEVFPAFLVAAVATFRARALDREEAVVEVNAASGLPSLQALRNSAKRNPGNLVALKIRNYSAIVGSFPVPVEARLASEIQRRIRISDRHVTVHQEGGMFLWFSTITDPVELFENLEGLHRIVQNGLQIEGRDVDISFNCGVDSDHDSVVATRLANAMQAAEEALRNDEIVCHYDSNNTNEAHWEISLLTSLDRAIDNGEVWVAYQPKLDLRTGRLSGAEALVRWTHPERGPISPDKFIGIAEEYHRIERITRFVLNDAVKSAVGLYKAGHDFTVSVNISAQLLRNADLPEMILDILDAHKLPTDRLVLEITETDRLDRSSRTFQMLDRLVAAGMKLSIDDFGTGNATIDYLRYVPAQEVKIDKLFISAIETNKEDFLLVQSIIEMAHSLHRTVVAEGVETAGMVQVLRQLHCDVVQGYHVSRPVPFRDLVAMLEPKALNVKD
ncbi:EAL domain-containing protein [Novosphingobium album (ex Liu et al. 2023)]|uniref:EAL domain-containing protein n=1 Tax=Novosphingobium album (ex Liu et al. 2023) TaxID=3031130 RepID=A0ABT5WUE8_9SPHN|nr:EAL domain-containing protein [Novosphingobium album (ex Liu et al. 2023)]MDE8653530.1 EAL domain-containing protein [Novosphingobium album (ex Liu et al. 2023)]